FIVIFHVDKEIVELSETEVLLENFQKFTLDNWRNFVGEPIARAYYNEQVWDCTILQVLPDDDYDATGTVNWLRAFRREKHCKIQTLLGLVKRVPDGRRQRFLPLENLQTESESDCQRSPSSFSRSVRLPQAEDSARAVQQSPSSLPLLPLPETRNPSAQLAVETAPPETPKSLPHHGQNDRCRSQQSAAELLSPSDQPGALRFNAAAADVASLNFGTGGLDLLKARMEAKLGVSLTSPLGLCYLGLHTLRRTLACMTTISELKQCMSRAAAAAATTFGPVDADAEWKPIATWPDYIDFIKNPPALEWMTRLLLPCKADDLGSTIRRMVRRILSPEMLAAVNYNGKGLGALSGSELGDTELAFRSVFLPSILRTMKAMYRDAAERPKDRDVELAVIAALKLGKDGRSRGRQGPTESGSQASAARVGTSQDPPPAKVRRSVQKVPDPIIYDADSDE
ncbi:hypothetical protein BOX15_Mlig021851g8, partial [Macrostomum lignano]